jgi:hypothetical protein
MIKRRQHAAYQRAYCSMDGSSSLVGMPLLDDSDSEVLYDSIQATCSPRISPPRWLIPTLSVPWLALRAYKRVAEVR